VPGQPQAAWVGTLVKNVTKPVGDVFMNLLFLPIIPLVFASLAVSVTRLSGAGGGAVGRIGLKTMAYFIVTTAFAAAIGITAVNVIKPGSFLSADKQEKLMGEFGKEATEKVEKKTDFGIATFVNAVPRNPLEAMLKKDMLAVIFTSILVGFALTRIDSTRAGLLIQFLEGVNQVAEFCIRVAMWVAPYGVFCLIFSTSALFGAEFLVSLGAFVATVVGGLGLHMFVVLPLLVYFLGGMNPIEFFSKTRATLLTAFSTSSSSATLPTAIKNATEDLNVPKPVAHFVLPLSATMNHNGTALFEAVTVLFLAQVAGVYLPLEQQLVVLILCVLTATGMAGVPGGSLPLIGLVLVQVNVDPKLIGLVLGVDRILDMCRTMVNVCADMTTAVFVARTERGRLPAAEPTDAEQPAHSPR
jgi:dicarboxylate/amino acid:cation (Na+ or H+) symporter, DAACS family